MTEPSLPAAPDRRGRTTPVTTTTSLWLLAMAMLCLWTAWKLGAFDIMTRFTADGRTFNVPNVFSAVDNPFHATRAYTLLQSLKDGHPLRWIGNHQGGYPAEFYPLGVAWIEVGMWALLFGALPIIAVHKLAVILIFLLPAVGFWVLARCDKVSPGVAVLATAIQVAVPGGNGLTSWATGGYAELVQWGLVTNVAGGTAAMVCCAMLVRYVAHGERGMAIGAGLFAAGAAYANPRSLFAIAIGAVAILIVTMISRSGVSPKIIVTRMVLPGAIGLLLAMPIVLPLLRYNTYYYFVRYQSYADWHEYLTASMRTASPVMFYACIIGGIVAIVTPRFVAARAMTLTLVGYVAFTAILSFQHVGINLVQQLETPRLMPFQRYLTIYLAAFAIWWVLDQAVHLVPALASYLAQEVAVGIAAVVVLIVYVLPVSGVPVLYQGLYAVPTSGTQATADYLAAVEDASGVLPQGTAIMAVGTIPSGWEWHANLWGPTETDAPFFYNDWLWDWNNTHAGTPGYRLDLGHFYPDPGNAFDASYLTEHGIGVVVATNVAPTAPGAIDPRIVARSAPTLQFQKTVGIWDIYTVRTPTAILTDGSSQPTAISIENEKITATFSGGDGTITLRRNWFPRWSATVDGKPARITETSDGYMSVQASAGATDIVLTYDVTGADWFARICAVLGVILVALCVAVRFMPVLARRVPDALFGRNPGARSELPEIQG